MNTEMTASTQVFNKHFAETLQKYSSTNVYVELPDGEGSIVNSKGITEKFLNTLPVDTTLGLCYDDHANGVRTRKDWTLGMHDCAYPHWGLTSVRKVCNLQPV